MKGKFCWLLLILICLTLFSSTGSSKEALLKSQWIEDVDYLAEKLSELHVNPYTKISKEEFQYKINLLKKNVPELEEHEILVEILKIIALIGDAHTSLAYSPKIIYPFSLFWFEEGIYVLQTTEKYREALNCKLVEINGRNIDLIIDTLSTVIPHENKAWLKKKIPQYLAFTEILAGLNIVTKDSIARFTFENKEGRRFSLDVKPIVLVNNQIRFISDFNFTPLYLMNKNKFYWYKHLSDKKTLYFKYNRCANMKEKSVSQFTDEIFEIIERENIQKLVIDLRGNTGGNSALLNPFIEKLAKNKDINQEGKLFVIINRDTFSSALLNAITLNQYTKAILVGEPTGGKPNHFGEVRYFKLPNSKMVVFYSTNYFKYMAEDPPSLMPDRIVPFSFEYFMQNRDPVMEIILNEY